MLETIAAIFAISFGAILLFLVYHVLELVTSWKVFEKYGEPGWKGLIPFYSKYVEYGKVWVAAAGLVVIALEIAQIFLKRNSEVELPGWISAAVGTALFVLRFCFSSKKSKAFGKGFGMTLLLICFPFIANLILGLGEAEYQGPQGADL